MNREEQKICINFFKAIKSLIALEKIDEKNFMLIHVPNGQRSGGSQISRKITGGIDKAMGALAGCPDYIAFYGESKFIFLECKTSKGKLSVSQRLIKDKCDIIGWPYYIFRSVQEGLEIFKKHNILEE